MRTRGKSDANQAAIVRAFRDIGATVQVLSAVGKGCPDILVGWRGHNILVECKNRDGRGVKLTADQVLWHAKWAGQVCVAESVEDAVKRVIHIVMKGAAA
jgi:Holliday junction resolvase